MRCRVSGLQLLLSNCVYNVAFLAKVEIKAIVALVSYADNRHLLAPMTLDILPYLLARLHDQLYPVSLMVMPTHLQFSIFIGPCEVTVLAEAEVATIRAHEAASDDWPHITAYTFIIVVSS